MPRQLLLIPALLIMATITATPAPSSGQDRLARPARKVLVELYTSQGCNSCPPAADLMGQLGALGFGPDQVVALNFHVDYFNTPWVDPFSDPTYSDREQSYNQVLKRTDLYFTPMMMVDGRTPLLGSNRAQAVAAIRQARTNAPAVALDLALEGTGKRRTATIKLTSRTADLAGRDLLIGVALTQDRASTRVPSGENAGKTLIEHDVVRRLDHKFVQLDQTKSKTMTFPLELPTGSDQTGFHVAVFVQDRLNGRVHQADAIPWADAPIPAKTASR